MVVDHFMLII